MGHMPLRQPRVACLTKREHEILKLLAEGRSVKDIASSFDLSVKTVEAHKFNLMRKLGIHNKAQLVQFAIQKKVIRLPEQVAGPWSRASDIRDRLPLAAGPLAAISHQRAADGR